jgi:hypothetical protein
MDNSQKYTQLHAIVCAVVSGLGCGAVRGEMTGRTRFCVAIPVLPDIGYALQKPWQCGTVYLFPFPPHIVQVKKRTSGAEEDAEKAVPAHQGVPQRLKPHRFQYIYGTAEAVPLTKTWLFQHPLKPN